MRSVCICGYVVVMDGYKTRPTFFPGTLRDFVGNLGASAEGNGKSLEK